MAKHSVCFVDIHRKKSFETKVDHIPAMGDVVRFPYRCVRVEGVAYQVDDSKPGGAWDQPYVIVSDATSYETDKFKSPGLDFTKASSPSEF